MGVDVYLEWEGQTEQEKEQYDDGIGYLRAGADKYLERNVIGWLFPSTSGNEYRYDIENYDFNANYEFAMNLSLKYVLYKITKNMLLRPLAYASSEESRHDLIKDGMAFNPGLMLRDKEQVERYTFAMWWVQPVISFFRLGMEKQEAGLNPRVLVS